VASYAPEEPERSLGYRILEYEGAADFIVLGSSADGLDVEVWSTSSQLVSRPLKFVQDDLRCSDGAVWLKPEFETGGDGSDGCRATHTLGLRKAENGDLIGEARTSTVGALLWVVPLAGKQVIRYRWAPLPRDAAARFPVQ
jgi:hypothetical protein